MVTTNLLEVFLPTGDPWGQMNQEQRGILPMFRQEGNELTPLWAWAFTAETLRDPPPQRLDRIRKKRYKIWQCTLPDFGVQIPLPP